MNNADHDLLPQGRADRLLQHVDAILKAKEYKFFVNSENRTIDLSFSGSKFTIDVVVFCGPDSLTFQARLPMVIRSEFFHSVVDIANDLSVRLPVGSFELNKKYGLFLFKVGRLTSQLPNDDEVELLLSLAVSSLDGAAEQVSAVVS